MEVVLWRIGQFIANATPALTGSTGVANCGDGTQDCDTGIPKVQATGTQVHEVLSIVFGAFAAVAVLMLVIAGLRFVTANGDPAEINKARSTIIYALVGLVISLSAEAFVAFALGKI